MGDDMGDFKVVFENKSGSDESTGKVTVKPDETKKKEEKKAEPKPEPKPFKMPKKVEKKPEPEPEPVPEEPKKIVKKKPSVKPKEEPKEEEAPFAMKLKKTERVQREWKDPEMETVKLAHHEFEKAPQPVEPEGKSTVKLGQPISTDTGERFTIEKKRSEVREGETIVQLEIQDTDATDQGSYQLVAKSE